jgi:putative ABC transport system permease protein
MRPAWRLAINSLSTRRSRTLLLISAVALSAALITAVSCAMASVHAGVRERVMMTVGAADLRVQRTGRDVFDAAILRQIEAWPEVTLVSGRLQGPIALKNPRNGKEVTSVGNGIMPEREVQIRPHEMVAGRMIASGENSGPGELALDDGAAKELEAQIGDIFDVIRFGTPVQLKLVGIIQRPPLGFMMRPESYVTLETMGELTEKPGKLREIDVLIKDSREAEAISKSRAPEFDKGIVLRPASKITSGLDKNLRSSQIGMSIASVLSFLAASFIIMTGLTTNVTERLRELAMLRCIGAMRLQLAESQLVIGLLLGILGAAAGLPIGMLGAFVLVKMFPSHLPGGFAVNWLGLAMALSGSTLAGLIGAAWPAVRAARTSPLEALTVRARPVRIRGLVLCGVGGLLCAGIHAAIFAIPSGPDFKFWADMTFGIPSAFMGYFLLSVPVLVLITLVCAGLVSRLFGLPRGFLRRNVLATPYRFGFTAGAMMMGLALLVAIWTNGRAITKDWLGSLQFPDGFASGISISEKTQERVASLPFVRDVCAVTIQNFKTDAFGLKVFDNANTSFVAFDPEPFFRMTKLTWVEGDPETAKRRLSEGGSVIIAQEYQIARKIGVGDKITLKWGGNPYTFDIVGVVASPGLDIASKFFDIGEEYLDQAVNAVFGNRSDLQKIFGNTGVQLLQFSLDPAVPDKEAIDQIRKMGGTEIVAAGSGRQIKAEITKVLGSSFLVMSVIALGAMLVASFGVANLIIAGVQARQFEFGVLRAIGAERSLLSRLVLAEATLVALTACIVGTLMGLQAAWAGQKMYEVMLGLVLHMNLPLGPTAAGWLLTFAITLGAAGPTVWALARRHPRELLSAVKG